MILKSGLTTGSTAASINGIAVSTTEAISETMTLPLCLS